MSKTYRRDDAYKGINKNTKRVKDARKKKESIKRFLVESNFINYR